jgi:hypothetical protein
VPRGGTLYLSRINGLAKDGEVDRSKEFHSSFRELPRGEDETRACKIDQGTSASEGAPTVAHSLVDR